MLQPYDKNKVNLRDFDECVALMRGGSKTFFAASRLLPKRVRQASVAFMLFAVLQTTWLITHSVPLKALKSLANDLI